VVINGTCLLIDVAISGERNVKKEAEKILETVRQQYNACGM
jgi:hypothetical protein